MRRTAALILSFAAPARAESAYNFGFCETRSRAYSDRTTRPPSFSKKPHL